MKNPNIFVSGVNANTFNCDTQTPPPSSLDEVCVQFNRRVRLISY